MTSSDRRKCGARTRQSEGTCKLPSGWGTDHAGHGPCRLHGGNTRNHRAAAVEAQAREVAARLGISSPVTDPLAELLHLAGEVKTWLTVTRERVDELIDADLLVASTEHGDEVRAIVRAYERALDRTAAVLAAIAKLRIDERLTAIRERDLAAVQEMLRIAHAAGAAGRSLDDARRDAARHLRAVPA